MDRMNHQCFLSLILSCFFITACTTPPFLKPDPAPPVGFIEHPENMTAWPERAAFLQKIWFKDREAFYRSRDRYKKIFFKPTRTEFLHSRGWWSELNSFDRKGYDEDVQTIARYIDSSLRTAVTADPKKRFELADWPDRDTIIYEFALAELVPTKVAVNVAGTALGAVVPGGGLVKATAKGSVAIEVAAYDGGSGELLLTWTDRKIDQGSLFSVRDFTPYMHSKSAIDSWTESLIEVWNTPASHKVEGLSSFTISPF